MGGGGGVKRLNLEKNIGVLHVFTARHILRNEKNVSQQTQYVEPTLFLCCAGVADIGSISCVCRDNLMPSQLTSHVLSFVLLHSRIYNILHRSSYISRSVRPLCLISLFFRSEKIQNLMKEGGKKNIEEKNNIEPIFGQGATK